MAVSDCVWPSLAVCDLWQMNQLVSDFYVVLYSVVCVCFTEFLTSVKFESPVKVDLLTKRIWKRGCESLERSNWCNWKQGRGPRSRPPVSVTKELCTGWVLLVWILSKGYFSLSHRRDGAVCTPCVCRQGRVQTSFWSGTKNCCHPSGGILCRGTSVFSSHFLSQRMVVVFPSCAHTSIAILPMSPPS